MRVRSPRRPVRCAVGWSQSLRNHRAGIKKQDYKKPLSRINEIGSNDKTNHKTYILRETAKKNIFLPAPPIELNGSRHFFLFNDKRFTPPLNGSAIKRRTFICFFCGFSQRTCQNPPKNVSSFCEEKNCLQFSVISQKLRCPLDKLKWTYSIKLSAFRIFFFYR